MFLSEVIPLYLEYRKSGGYAKATVHNDRRYLSRTLEILGDVDMMDFSPQHMDIVIHTEANRGLQPGSINMVHSSLAAFFRWCRDRGYMGPAQNPVGGRRYRKDPPKRKSYINVSEFESVLSRAELHHPRDRAFVAAGLYLLLRQGEIAALRVRDVDLASGEVAVRIFKTKEDDVMPISKELDTELRRWFLIYAAECGPLQPDWYLFPSGTTKTYPDGFRKGIELVPTRKLVGTQNVVHRAVTHLDIPEDERVGCHLLRRSSARAHYNELLAIGYSGALRRVQTLLHHSSTTMTERYLGLDFDKETRNLEIKGQHMFPSVQAENIIPMRRESNG